MNSASALRLATFAGMLLLGAYAEAGSVSLQDGRDIVDPVVLGRRPDGLEVGHRGGVSFIKFEVMPPEIQRKFGYDPAKAADYERQQQSARAQMVILKERRAAEAAAERAAFNEQLKERRAEHLAEDIEKAKIRIAFLAAEIPKLEQQYDKYLDQSTELAGKNVTNPRATGGYAWDGGYMAVGGSAGSRAESNKRRTLHLLSDELAETKKTLEAHKRELEDKQFGIVEMQRRLDAMDMKQAR